MKKTKKLKMALAAVAAAVMALGGSGVFAAPHPTIEKADIFEYDSKLYTAIGENLFIDGEFDDTSGEHLTNWYVGTNTYGDVIDGADYAIPKINSDGSLVNLTPLKDSPALRTGNREQDDTSTDVFYYGADGSNEYLVEGVQNWQGCAWNGVHSLLAFIKIKPNSQYYFSFRAFTVNNKAAVRYGAINMDTYAPAKFEKGKGLYFTGEGYVNCKSTDEQNVGGGWTKYETVINSGEDGEYFLFNAYWLQVSNYLCIDDFKLYEVEPVELKPALGWDGNAGKFTMDFLFNDSFTPMDGWTYGVEAESQDGQYFSGEFKYEDNCKGLGLGTAFTNLLYRARPIAAKDGSAAVKGNYTTPESIYSLVMKAVKNKAFSSEIEGTQLDAVNEVLKNGGIYIENGNLTEETALVMDIDKNETTITLTLNKNAVAAGLRFSNYTAAQDSENNLYTFATDNEGTTATIVLADGASSNALETVYLEEIELVFIPEEITETETPANVTNSAEFQDIL